MPNQTNPYAPSPQNPSYSSGNVTVTNSIGSSSYPYLSGVNGLSSADLGALTITQLTPPKPIALMGIDAALDIGLVFNTEEAGLSIKMEFSPEPDISVNELMKIMMLVTLVANNGVQFSRDTIGYVRKHNLLRHFTLTAA